MCSERVGLVLIKFSVDRENLVSAENIYEIDKCILRPHGVADVIFRGFFGNCLVEIIYMSSRNVVPMPYAHTFNRVRGIC
jgi:hypothetical protein